MVVRVPRYILRNFTKRAWRRVPREHLEVLLGNMIGGVLHVSAIYHIESVTDRWSASYVEEDALDNLQDDLEDTKLKVVGTIHTHVGSKTCEHHSDADIESHIQDEEIVSAVMNLWVKDGIKRSAISFYCPFEPVVVEYT